MDEAVELPGYEGSIRQLAVTGLGRDQPTLFLSNNREESARNLIKRYAGRNRVEDGLGISVNFFHLDCLASEVRLNVDVDVMLTVLANGCYRWLATQLKGFEKTAPKQLYRTFVETGGVIEIQAQRIIVRLDRRCHNPILREATTRLMANVSPGCKTSQSRLNTRSYIDGSRQIVGYFRATEVGVEDSDEDGDVADEEPGDGAKEVAVHLLAYNWIRGLRAEAARAGAVQPRRLRSREKISWLFRTGFGSVGV